MLSLRLAQGQSWGAESSVRTQELPGRKEGPREVREKVDHRFTGSESL